MCATETPADYSEFDPDSPVVRILDSMPALISYVDRDLRYRFNNRAYKEWFGQRREDLRGKRVEEVLGAEAVAGLLPHVEAALRGETTTFESLVDYEHAGRRWIRADYVPDPAPDGSIRGFFAMVSDITEARQAQEAARESETEYRAFFDLTGTGNVLGHPATGRLLGVNRAFCELLGYSEAELVGRTFEEITHPEDRAMHRAEVGPAMRGERDHFEIEKRYVRKDGQVFWGHVTGTILRDSQGRPYRSLASILDVTARKQAESEREELLARVQEANQALEEAGRQKDRFLAVLAHELRNPLAAVSGAVRAASQDPGQIEWLMTVLGRNIGFLERLVEDLLDMSRLASGQIRLISQSLDLGDAVRLGASDAEPLVRDRGHHLDIRIPSRPLPAQGDPARLRQIVANLVGNSARFTDEPGRIVLSVFREGTSYLVEVEDHGIGIDPAMMDRIYEMFGQAEGDRGASRGGMGIGLALARQLAELHGGSLTGSSPGAGQGSTFTLRLPAPSEDEPPAPARVAQATPDCSGMRVLVVDDNRDAAATLECLLELAGARVDVAHDGLSALAQASATPPDAVVLDLVLPRLPGHEVAATLRTRGFAGPIVVVSGHGRPEDRRRSLEAGVDLHLVKPADIHELLLYLSATRPGHAV